MAFDASAYGGPVASILALDGAGGRLMPLTRGACSSEGARAALKSANPRELFPLSRDPQAALAGLYLYFSCWDEAHATAQDIATPEGSFWHAIVHRQEPDDWNSGYWFRQVGRHAIFPRLAERAAEFGIGGGRWDPMEFIAICAEARKSPGSDAERRALEVQRIEWQLLFDHCAAKPAAGRTSSSV
jgi:hypothetical protein